MIVWAGDRRQKPVKKAHGFQTVTRPLNVSAENGPAVLSGLKTRGHRKPQRSGPGAQPTKCGQTQAWFFRGLLCAVVLGGK